MLEFRIYGFFEDGQELRESALQGGARALRRGHAEDGGGEMTDCSGRSCGPLKEAPAAEHSMNIVEDRGNGRWRACEKLRELALGPVHDDKDAVEC